MALPSTLFTQRDLAHPRRKQVARPNRARTRVEMRSGPVGRIERGKEAQVCLTRCNKPVQRRARILLLIRA